MRPGRARPGCRGAMPGGMRFYPASMRPGRARPGCTAPDWSATDHPVRFNEAGARAPRMPATGRRPRTPRRSFNEAGARAPRMHFLIGRYPDHRGIASMRPGRARPGCSGSLGFTDARLCRFNEAGARAPRMRSWRDRRARGCTSASMRPGRARPGCAPSPTRPRSGPRASMRPGRARPGCVFRPQANLVHVAGLQ